MSEIDINLLRKDECQPLTNEQMNDIKSQFHPSNTANVNITPYHIYDTDEHVVGEWRETISGVKKKKPVYEKKISGTTPSVETTALGINISNIDVLCELGGYAGYPLSIPLMYTDENNFFKGYKTSTGLEIWCKGTAVFSKPYNIIVRYTKTTDSWEVV